MKTYPAVLGEMETLERVLAGASLARYGDGEFALCEFRDIRMQRHHFSLSARLRGILWGDGGDCLVGIPNLLAPLPARKAKFWKKYTSCAALLNEQQSYVSSFVSRPDNAPWLDEPSYWARVEHLWAGLDVTLVRGDDPNGTAGVSLVAADLVSAKSVTEIVAPAVNAWSDYKSLMVQIGSPKRALLCLGPTATVMAVDLCRVGVHAIDLGHLGFFRNRHRAGLPMQRTAQETAA